jgi:hypothetical protein
MQLTLPGMTPARSALDEAREELARVRAQWGKEVKMALGSQHWYNSISGIESPGGAANTTRHPTQEVVSPMCTSDYTPATQICRVCSQEKPLTTFEPTRRGHRRVCYSCKWARTRSNPTLLEAVRARTRRRNARIDPTRHKRPTPPIPEHKIARDRIQAAIRWGKVERPTACSDCGVACKPHAHHEDYSRPFDVVWLCRGCHGKRHRKGAQEATA